jgi:ABC-2 type transport system permease protein
MPARIVVHQFRYDLRSFLRDKQARFTTLILPIVLLLVLVSVGGGDKSVVEGGREIKVAVFYIPGLIALGIVSASFANLVVDLVTQRESGVLKRRRATPVPAWALIAGRTLTAAAASLVTAAILLFVGAQVYDFAVPNSALPAAAVVIALGSAAFSTLSYAVAPLIRTAAAIQPFIQLVLLPLYFISGVLIPQSKNPGWVNDIATVFPLAHVAHGLHRAFDPTHSGLGLGVTDLLVLAAWTGCAFVFAVRRFTWLPHGTAGER